ncbi:MAG: sodium/solute symporter [Sedimentisphaeraceae bacterium JB056]
MKNLKVNRCVFLVLLILTVCTLAVADSVETEGFFEFERIAPLGAELDKAFVGRDGENLLVIGGFKSQVASNAVFMLDEDGQKWAEISPLQNRVYGGAAVSTSDGVICIGGYKDDVETKEVVRYWIEEDKLHSEQMPELPVFIPDVKAALASGHIYAVGAEAAFSMDLLAKDGKWKKLDAWQPIDGKVVSVAAVSGRLFVFTNNEGFRVSRLSPDKIFEQLGQTDYDLSNMVSAPCGLAHIVFLSKYGQSNDILAYHTFTNKWVILGELPQSIKPVGVVFDDVEFGIIGVDSSVNVKAVMPATKYGWVDHGVVVVFMVGMLLVGAYLSKREKNSEDYFRGGKRVPWWASGLSMFATGASAISLMAVPGKAFSDNWFYFGATVFSIITIPPLAIYLYMPIARRLEVATANEYLERRYNIFLRIAGSIIWSFLQILGRMSAVMILPAIAISSITGIPIEVSIVIMGVVTTCYVFLGGLEGVIWTDVLQAIVMIMAVVVCLVWAITGLDMSFSQGWSNIQTADKLHMFDWNISFVEPCAFILFLNILVNTLGMIGDQNFIQRMQCTPNEKESKKAIIMSLVVAVPLNAVLFSLGTILFLFYMEKPEMLSPATKSDGIFPLFAAQNLPVGLAGLVIAAILAATMSTLSSALNSVANLGVEDFYRRFKKDATDHSCVILGRILTASLGVFGTVSALFLVKTDLTSIWDLCMVIFGVLLGAITGIYTLGIFTKRTNSAGAVAGVIASLAATYYVMNYTHMHFLAYPAVGVVACYVVGYLVSIVIPAKQKDITGLTVYTLQKSSE